MNAAAPFRLEHALLGPSRMSGLVHDRFGKLRRSFVGRMHGDIQDGCLVLKEELRYDDGAIDRRCWRLALPFARHGAVGAGDSGCVAALPI